jgi:hypothetical protein
LREGSCGEKLAWANATETEEVFGGISMIGGVLLYRKTEIFRGGIVMRETRFLALAAALVLALTTASPAAAGPGGAHQKIQLVQPGHVFCPATPLIRGNVVIPSGRCYSLGILRDTRGTFLVFAEPGMSIPPGQLVRLTTPAGAKLRGRIFFLVPIQTTTVLVPVNTIEVVPVRVEDLGPRVSITVVSTPSPNVTIIFNAQLP